MKRYFQSSISAVALSAMVMSGVAATVSITASPAFSKSNNVNSNSNNDNRNDNSDPDNRSNNGRGSTASSLGALNAAHANANALANAATNSRVGMIEIYKLAVGETAAASAAFDAAEAALGSFVDQCGLVADGPLSVECLFILAEATTLAGDTITEPYTHATYLAALNQAVSDAYDAEVNAKDLENIALQAAANKVTSDEVIIALWDLLDLPED
ncbi:MAG: hypothetical protein KAS85_01015 [Rhodobacteraceae bacterium]|nr:hypothetical protein [Paracoccaceae bacterium]